MNDSHTTEKGGSLSLRRLPLNPLIWTMLGTHGRRSGDQESPLAVSMTGRIMEHRCHHLRQLQQQGLVLGVRLMSTYGHALISWASPRLGKCHQPRITSLLWQPFHWLQNRRPSKMLWLHRPQQPTLHLLEFLRNLLPRVSRNQKPCPRP